MPGVPGPSQVAETLYSMSQKKFSFLQPESDPFSLLGRKLSHLFGRDFVSLFQGGAKTEAN